MKTPSEKRIEMIDGRIYVSPDNWQTIYRITPSGRRHKVTDPQEIGTVRILVASGAG